MPKEKFCYKHSLVVFFPLFEETNSFTLSSCSIFKTKNLFRLSEMIINTSVTSQAYHLFVLNGKPNQRLGKKYKSK